MVADPLVLLAFGQSRRQFRYSLKLPLQSRNIPPARMLRRVRSTILTSLGGQPLSERMIERRAIYRHLCSWKPMR
jgi:hypothetical protein